MALPTVDKCLAAADHRLRVSIPNHLRLQCCAASVGYCIDCPQDMQGLCIAGPVDNRWANYLDGELPEVEHEEYYRRDEPDLPYVE